MLPWRRSKSKEEGKPKRKMERFRSLTTPHASGEMTTLQDRTVVQQHHLPEPLPGPLYVAKYDFDACDDDELSFKKGELMYILNFKFERWWFARSKVSNKEGYVPYNYVEHSLKAYDWYFGKIKRHDAEETLLLPINRHGSYLIRENETMHGNYILSVRDGFSVQHYGIHYGTQQGRFYISGKSFAGRSFADIADLVTHHKKDADGLCVNLKKSCIRPELPELPQIDVLSGSTQSEWEIPRSSIRVGLKIGRGWLSEVSEGLWNNKIQVAVKTLKDGRMTKKEFFKVARIMKELHNPNVIKTLGVCITADGESIVTELMENGSLLDYLRGNSRALKMPQLIDIGAQIANGMAYLGTQGCIHRNLKANNVLVGCPLVAKVSGFGLARVPVGDVYEAHAGSRISVKWTAPEAIMYNRWSVKSDVWSFGILLTELVTKGRKPYPDMKNPEVVSQIEQGYRMLQIFGCPNRLYEMMLECWKKVDMERPTFKMLQWQLEGYYTEDDIGGAVKRMGPEEKIFYEQAAKQGVLKIPRVKLDAIGDEDAGKSCLSDSIMDQPYIEGRSSTKGVLMKMAMRTAIGLQGKWEEMGKEKFDEELDKLLARGYVSYMSDNSAVLEQEVVVSNGGEATYPPPNSTQENGVSERDQATAAHPQPNSTAENGVIEKELATAASLPVSRSTCDSVAEGSEIPVGLDEFIKILELNDSKEAFIQELQQNMEKLRQYEDSTVITLMDRGGQEQYLSIHAALMPDNMSNATGYLVVVDITKPLDEEVTISYYRHKNGQVIEQKRETRTRADTLRHWIAAVEAAHPHDAEVHHHRFLGRNHGVKRSPAVFIVVTRKDQIPHLREEFVKKQEQLLCDVICESQHFADHLVPYQKDPYDVLFRVDNTKSGSSNPDPVMVQLRDMIVEMTQSHCKEGEGTPLTYVMLEIGLSKVGRIANNKGKVLDLNNILRLAQEACNLSPGGECTTALRYLSNMGAICFYSEAPGLEEKVFPDPQWLADIMSTFVTVLGEANVDPKLWHDLRRLHSEGLMTWKLAEYLLNKAGVDASVQEAILLVLQMFHIIAPSLQCPDLEQKEASVKVGHDILVPCMVIEEYSKMPPAYQSAIKSAEAMPPLFLCPKGFSAFLKPLFYRLIACLVTKYQYRPNIKRHQVILHLPNDLELEIVYTTKAVIATLYAVDPDYPPSLAVLQQECRFLKTFLVQQLKCAKRRGMDGFKFEVCIHPVREELDYKELACIDNYPHDPLINRCNKRLTKRRCPKLDLWVLEEQAEGSEYAATSVDASSQDQLYDRPIAMHPHVAVDSIRAGTSDSHNISDGSQAQAGNTVCSLRSVISVILEHGCDQWYEMGRELGLSMAQIRDITHSIPLGTGKLQAIIETCKRSVKDEEMTKELLRACHRIPRPIHGVVEEELKEMERQSGRKLNLAGSGAEGQ